MAAGKPLLLGFCLGGRFLLARHGRRSVCLMASVRKRRHSRHGLSLPPSRPAPPRIAKRVARRKAARLAARRAPWPGRSPGRQTRDEARDAETRKRSLAPAGPEVDPAAYRPPPRWPLLEAAALVRNDDRDEAPHEWGWVERERHTTRRWVAIAEDACSSHARLLPPGGRRPWSEGGGVCVCARAARLCVRGVTATMLLLCASGSGAGAGGRRAGQRISHRRFPV